MSDTIDKEDKALFAEERKRRLVEYINEKRRVTVPQLCRDFSVSSATIRNDLRELDEMGQITRTHGGAIKKSRTGYESAIDKRISGMEEKRNIAKTALGCIDDGDTIILDTGTTTTELARILGKKMNITVITNDLSIAALLESINDVEVLVIGGVLRKGFHCTVDHRLSSLLDSVSVDKAFMGANSFSIARGASTPDIAQAGMKQQMISIASKVIVLCDHSKLETNSLMVFAPVADIDLLITDRISPEFQNTYKETDIEILSDNPRS
jgi:DeoR family transcriptional regulator, fructose operon transcriptional repressor